MPTTFESSARHGLLAMLSATLLAACGGGDYDAELDAAVATGQVDPDAAPTVSFEAASAHASRSPMGGGRRAPICMFAPPDCQPNLPPTQ